MRRILIGGLMVVSAALSTAPAASAQPAGPALGDPAPPPAAPASPDPAPENRKPDVVETLGGAVGGVLGSAAGAVGGPLGSAAAGFVGRRVGAGAVSAVRKVVGDDKDDDDDLALPARIAQPDLPEPIPAADIAAADASAAAPLVPKLALPPAEAQSIQIAPPAPASSSSPAISAASPGG